MAVTFRSVGVSPGANSTSCVIVKPAGLSVGDLMIAQVVVHTLSGSITTPGGWTLIRTNTDFVAPNYWLKSNLFWKIADSDDVAAANFTFTVGTGCNRGAITAWTGHDPITPINADSGQTQTSTTVTAPTITPSVANCEILMFCAVANNNTQSNYAIANDNPAIWSERYDLLTTQGEDCALAMASATRPETTATGDGTATTSAWEENIGQLVAIAPAAIAITKVQDTEVIDISDEMIRRLRSIRLAAATIGITDAIIKIKMKCLAETEGLTDTALKRSWAIRLIAEVMGITDTLIRKGTRNPLITAETVDISDSGIRAFGMIRVAVNEVIGLTDSLVKIIIKATAETIDIADAAIRRLWSIRLTVETVNITETANKIFIKMLSEIINIVDTALRRANVVRLIDETVNIVEVVVRRARSIREFAEQLTILDSAMHRIRSVRIFLETVSIQDSMMGFLDLIVRAAVKVSRMEIVRLGVSRMALTRMVREVFRWF